MSDNVWCEDVVLQRDLERIADSDVIDWEKLRGKTVLVTGATGAGLGVRRRTARAGASRARGGAES